MFTGMLSENQRHSIQQQTPEILMREQFHCPKSAVRQQRRRDIDVRRGDGWRAETRFEKRRDADGLNTVWGIH